MRLRSSGLRETFGHERTLGEEAQRENEKEIGDHNERKGE
jgi:hypothetical protein